MPSLDRETQWLFYHTLHPLQRSAFLAPVPALLMTKSESVDHLMGSSELCVHFHQSSELFTSPVAAELSALLPCWPSAQSLRAVSGLWLVQPSANLWPLIGWQGQQDISAKEQREHPHICGEQLQNADKPSPRPCKVTCYTMLLKDGVLKWMGHPKHDN